MANNQSGLLFVCAAFFLMGSFMSTFRYSGFTCTQDSIWVVLLIGVLLGIFLGPLLSPGGSGGKKEKD